jgi:hypothetical protein
MRRPHSRLWWYFRFRRAYRNHGVIGKTRKSTWQDARIAAQGMPIDEQWLLRPLKRRRAD